MNDAVDLDDFRSRMRGFVAQHLPEDIRQTVREGRQVGLARLQDWHAVLAQHGLLVPHWPVQWGGQGFSVVQQMVFDEEMAAGDAPELNSITFDMIGPVLQRFGSPAQQQAFLPAIASGRQWWRQ